MRTIKFKGLRVDGKGWAYGYLVKTENGQCYIFNYHFIPALTLPSEKFIEVIPETVGQFTGKLTSDEVEIYEADLIKTWNGSIPKVVNWNEKECSWYFGIKPLANLRILHKIIGNIHEK